MKTKSTTEIASQLFEYIRIFGRCKELLSDRGSELLKQVVDQLAKTAGIERKVSSAYHPGTNGLTERYNQTLIETQSPGTGTNGSPRPTSISNKDSYIHKILRVGNPIRQNDAPFYALDPQREH